MNQTDKDFLKFMACIALWVGALMFALGSCVPMKAAEPMFTIPGIVTQAQKDKEIRWYSSKEAPSTITANGEYFWDNGYTFASRTLPFGTRLTVTYKGKTITVRCNDRGPNLVELTLGAFSALENPDVGVLRGAVVRYEVI